tara:strand:+ start:4252 stop:5244 length:993 start_codon:yes stop_codon:yes gene_type:complete
VRWVDKVLIIRFSSIGDIVFTTAVVEALKGKGFTIDFMTLSSYVPILESHPYIDRIISVPRDAGMKQLRWIGSDLRSEGYSQLIDLHSSLRSRLVRSGLRGNRTTVYKKHRIKRFLLFYLNWNRFNEDFELTKEYLELAGIGTEFQPTLYVDPEEEKKISEQLKNFGVDGSFIALVPGAAWPNKLWTVSGYRELIDSYNGTVVVLGGENDAICGQISDGFSSIINLQGKTDLRTSLVVLSLAEMAVGSDTGLIHAAEALGTPVVMLSGPTARATGANVRHVSSTLLYSDVWCRPCSKQGARNCFRKERYCMTGISVSDVQKSVNGMVGSV